LKRDKNDRRIVTELSPEEGLDYLVAHDLCNPHQLVRDKRKTELRKNFYGKLLERSTVHMVNTIQTPQESQEAIRRVLGE